MVFALLISTWKHRVENMSMIQQIFFTLENSSEKLITDYLHCMCNFFAGLSGHCCWINLDCNIWKTLFCLAFWYHYEKWGLKYDHYSANILLLRKLMWSIHHRLLTLCVQIFCSLSGHCCCINLDATSWKAFFFFIVIVINGCAPTKGFLC